MISVAAELAGMHPPDVAHLRARGPVNPSAPRSRPGSLRSDVERLAGSRADEIFGLNLAGVERVLELEELMDAMQEQLEAARRAGRELEREMLARIEQVTARTSASWSCGDHRLAQQPLEGDARCSLTSSRSSPRRRSRPPRRWRIERGNPEITPEHLLSVLLEQEGGIVRPLLGKLGVAARIRRASSTPRSTSSPSVSRRGLRRGPPLGRARARVPGGRARGRSAEGRVHLDRAPAAGAGRLARARRRRSWSAQARRATRSWRRSRRCAARTA